MPEYRRFISYFYEYIDGKKQRNTGFAKVELRNGVWRILFRLTVPIQPRPPVEVFGFMREGKKLTGYPMGTMRAGKEMTEEWAYSADEPVWIGRYGLSDISGIWILSGDGRCFATVWDDEPVNPALFIKYEAQEESRPDDAEEELEPQDNTEETLWQPDDIEKTEENFGERRAEPEPQEDIEEMLWQPGHIKEELNRPDDMRKTEENFGEKRAEPERLDDMEKAPCQSGNIEEISVQQNNNIEETQELPENEEETPYQPEEAPEQSEKIRNAEKEPEAEKEEAVSEENLEIQREEELRDDRLWRELYDRRAPFQPFLDQEISSCIRVVPGDIVILQNAHWRTGKNNFLLHGYHNYRHLLIGRNADGGYVLGVPGIMNPQERYMAAMFGFPDFKYADSQGGNSAFGYWCRPLKKENR